MFDGANRPVESGRAGAAPEEGARQAIPHASTSKTFRLYQAAVDASKLVASRTSPQQTLMVMSRW